MRCDSMFRDISPVFTIDNGNSNTREVAALNTFQWSRNEIVRIPAESADQFMVQTSQRTGSGDLFVPIQAKGTSATVVAEVGTQVSQVSLTSNGSGEYVLTNERVRVTIVGGEITSFVDLDLDRELIPDGERGNKLVLFYDQAMTFWDAWDVEIYHLESPEYLGAGTVTVIDNGPLRATLQVLHQIGEQSWIKSTISLDAYQRSSTSTSDGIQSLLTVDCEVEWHENRRFLKVEFPWDLHSEHATYETQFGVVRNPTHYNTSWDYARFENVCHRFADLSEYGYGVSILNDSKYGFETQGNIQRLSLLRSPKGPDPNTDMGRQCFSYAIAPHTGSFMAVGPSVVREGLNFNNPMRIVKVGNAKNITEMLSCITIHGTPNIILSNIKRGEDDEDLDGYYKIRHRPGKSIVLRIYEALGGSGKAMIKT
jgi:alpha-mannosidase